MQAWQNRKVFGLAKQLHLSIDDLRGMAAEINEGKHSLSALSYYQAGELLNHLYRKAGLKPGKKSPPSPLNKGELVNGHPDARPDDKPWDYLANNGKWSQMDMLFDYVIKLNWSVDDLRLWLRRYFKVDREDWLTRYNRPKAIEGLKAQYKRQTP